MEKENNKKLRILAAGDLHGLELASKELADMAEKENVDLVVITGDMLEFGEYAKDIIKPFVDKKKPVLFVPGNHDPPDAMENMVREYKIKNLHGSYAIYNDVGFFGSGGSSNLPHFPFFVSEKEMYKSLKSGFEKIKATGKKIMITHEHPAGSKIEKFCGFPGSESIKKAIDTFHPDIHICGHIHELEGFQEKIGNTKVVVTGNRGTIIEV